MKKRIIYIDASDVRKDELVAKDGRRIPVNRCEATVSDEGDCNDRVWLNRLPVVCVGCGREFFACEEARALCVFCQIELAGR